VIIPTKNEEGNIGRCLDSIKLVEWDPQQFEVIVVDNGSSDQTPRIAQMKGARLYVQPRLTISGLRNFAASQSRGRILAFMDADCVVDRLWLREASRYLDRLDVVLFGSPPRVPPEATWVQRAWYQVRRKKVAVGETVWLESMNMFVRREAFFSCGGFDESLVTCEDYDLSLRVARRGKVMTDSGIVAWHYGEARDILHFFRKESWRGIGNRKGMLRHGVRLVELPSLFLPLLHCLVILALPLSLLASLYAEGGALVCAASAFAVWQGGLLLLCFLKYRQALPTVPQIFVLLNVYYLARGAALLRQP
jgi:glycosyltransferase involved in cell wall biosynthesis